MESIVPERSWDGVLAAIAAAPRPVTAYVVGRSDTGKTTLARHLVQQLGVDRTVGYLDCDPGQSTVGPPATIGLRIYDRATGQARDQLCFAGSVSPADHPLTSLKAMTRLAAAARSAACDAVVVDSSGFVDGAAGRHFQREAVRSLHPEVLVVIGRGPWSEGLERADDNDGPGQRLVGIPGPSHVRARTPAERREHRMRLFTSYFQRATVSDLPLGPGPLAASFQRLADGGDWEGRLLGLLDVEGFLLSLALPIDLRPADGLVRVAARAYASGRLGAVAIGTVGLRDLRIAWTAGANGGPA